MSSLSKQITINTAVQLLGKGVTTTIGIIITALLTRYFGASGFGDYSFVIFVVGTAVTVSNWGLNLIIVREASQNENEQAELIGNGVIVRSALSLVAALIVILLTPFLSVSETLKIALNVSGLMIFALSLKDSIYAVFMTKLKMENWSVAELLASTVLLLVAILTVYLNLTLPYLIAGQAFANFLAIILAIYLSKKVFSIKINFNYLKKKIHPLAIETLPMGAILILFTLYNHIDNLLLYSWKGSEAAGIYGLSYKIYDVLNLPAAYLMNSLLPVFSREAELLKIPNAGSNIKNLTSKISVYYTRTFDILLIAGFILFLVIIFLAPAIIKLLSGDKFLEFKDSIPLLQILAFSNILSFLNHLTGFTIVAIRKQKLSFYYATIALIINLSINAFLIPRLSYFGAAWATIITEGSILIMTSILIYKVIGVTPSTFRFYKTILLVIKSKGHIFDY